MDGLKILISVSWGSRRESAEKCADRWLAAMRGLVGVDRELFGRWSVIGGRGRRREAGLDTREGALAAVQRGVNREDAPPRRIIEELGFRFGAANDLRGDRAVFMHVSAGKDSPVLQNVAHVDGRPRSDVELRRWARIAEPSLHALVEAWEPDFGHVYTHPVANAQQPGEGELFGGYVTYLSQGRCGALPSDLPGTWHRMPDGGLVVSLITDQGAFPEDERVVELGRRLRAAGAFAPAPVDRPRL